MRIGHNKIWQGIIIGSLILNVFFITEEGYNKYNRMRMMQEDSIISPQDTSIYSFQAHLMEGAEKTLSERIERYVPGKYNSLQDRVRDLLGEKRVWSAKVQYGYSEAGYMMQAIFNTAKYHNDIQGMESVKKAFDENCLNNKIVRVDQSPYGTVAIYLYDTYKEKKYKDYADSVYSWLKKQDTEKYGILFDPNSIYNHVDGVGVFNPFLVEYSRAFNCPEAYNLAVSCFEKWCKYGVEKELGRPAQHFHLKYPHERGRCDWGRGFSWHTLGFCMLNEDDLSDEACNMIKKFDDYILYIYNRDHQFTQFVNSPTDGIDLSATLPLVWHLYSQNRINLSENEILEYSKYMYNNIMFHSSGVLFEREVQFTSSQRLSQAFMLNIILLYEMSLK